MTAGFATRALHAAHANGPAAFGDDGTVRAVEARLAALEGGVAATLLASGQAAIATAVLGLVRAGEHVVAASSIYEGTRELLRDNLRRWGIDATFVADANDPAHWRAATTPRTRVWFAEAIPNPKNDVLDIAPVARAARRAGAVLIVDSTLATPALLRPLEHGADVVVHSASKFLAGHGTVLGGVIVEGARLRASDPSFAGRVRTSASSGLGAAPSPFNAALIGWGLDTLALRMRRQSANALRLAGWLERQPGVRSVDYSGLASSPHARIARRYLPNGHGGVLAVTVEGGREGAAAFFEGVSVFTRMTHLGDVRSLILHPASTTHILRTPAELAAAGIGEGTLRLSIGVEDADDLQDDLARGLAAARAVASPVRLLAATA